MGFEGVFPRRSPRLLTNPQAQTAQNVDLRSGELRAYNNISPVNKPTKTGTVNTIFHFAPAQGGDASGVITGATNANPVAVTATAHGLSTGERVYIDNVAGMTEINGLTHTITVTDANTFTLDGVNGTAYGAYASGGLWEKENGYWFHWVDTEAADGVSVVRGTIGADTVFRTYYADGTLPKMTYSPLAVTGGTDYPDASYTLGVPAPTAAPVAAKIAASITGATQANPVAITSTAHGRTTGEQVTISGVVGMTELNGNTYTITVTDANTFTLDNIDGTAYTAYTSGGTWTLGTTANPTSHSWVMTYVSALGEEGPPSAASNILDVNDGEHVQLSSLPTGPSGSYNITNKRIYRSQTGASGQRFYFIAEIAIATATYEDTMGSFNEAIQSTEWDPPPADLQGLVVHPNGYAVGFSKNQLCFSVPYQLHAWPTSWRQNTEYTITGLGVTGTTLVVATEEQPYLAQGTHPASTTMLKLDLEQACVSWRSVVSMPEIGVLYASPDGLMNYGSNGARNIIEAWMSRKEWQALNPDSMHAYYWDGRYVCFYDNVGGFIFDWREGGAGLIFLDLYAEAGYSDPLTDTLYLYTGGKIQAWERATTALSYTWKSRKYHVPRPTAMKAGQVLASSYASLTCKIYADGVLKHTQTVLNDSPFRLPEGSNHRQWEIEISGTDTVQQVLLAETVSELAGA